MSLSSVLPYSDSEMLNLSKSSSSESCCILNEGSGSTPHSSSQWEKGSLLFSQTKPHRAQEPGWQAITALERKQGTITVRDFRLVRRIGGGDLGNVYLCRLKGSECLFAMKVMDKKALAHRKKLKRAEMERDVLRVLDHPFLPTLFAGFETSHYACMVVEFCSGGDLHTLRHRLQGKKFDLLTARFYSAEVLLALEYLHMIGIIYRDLKPENVLLRSDGHIMLTDFDLSLKCKSIPSLQPRSKNTTNLCSYFPFRRFFQSSFQKHQVLFTAEPVGIRSCSFVGTHEYISPEVASGGCHGNAVDWWAFGVFLYELIYGKTPFSGGNNSVTLRNIVKQPLKFPQAMSSSEYSLECGLRNLISGLLVKEPDMRLGSKFGAAEIKRHPFFRGLNFALIRSSKTPEFPSSKRYQEKAAKFDFF